MGPANCRAGTWNQVSWLDVAYHDTVAKAVISHFSENVLISELVLFKSKSKDQCWLDLKWSSDLLIMQLHLQFTYHHSDMACF